MTMQEIFSAVITDFKIPIGSIYKYDVIERMLHSYLEYLYEVEMLKLNIENGFLKLLKIIEVSGMDTITYSRYFYLPFGLKAFTFEKSALLNCITHRIKKTTHIARIINQSCIGFYDEAIYIKCYSRFYKGHW